jgi:hypothetical protein
MGERFLPKSPTPCPEDINYTPWFSNIKSNANNTPNQPCHEAKKRDVELSHEHYRNNIQ